MAGNCSLFEIPQRNLPCPRRAPGLFSLQDCADPAPRGLHLRAAPHELRTGRWICPAAQKTHGLAECDTQCIEVYLSLHKTFLFEQNFEKLDANAFKFLKPIMLLRHIDKIRQPTKSYVINKTFFILF